MTVQCRRASAHDHDAIVELLTLAFAHDPVWNAWAFPDRRRAFEHRRALFALWTQSALRYEGIRVTQDCEAAALWYPAGSTENVVEDQVQLDAFAKTNLGPHADLFLQGCALIEGSQPQHHPHFYLSLLGTHDRHRGKGLGMQLLKACLDEFDGEGMPAYLESTNPDNDARYESLGFAPIGSYALPGGGPRITMMWRDSADKRTGL